MVRRDETVMHIAGLNIAINILMEVRGGRDEEQLKVALYTIESALMALRNKLMEEEGVH